jgi:hypothetical protein
MPDVYKTTVNFNGETVYSSTYRLGGCCCNNMFTMNSCFGFGYPCLGSGIGFGVGMMAGAALIPAMPSIVKGIGQGCSWLATKVIAPFAVGAYNYVIKPVFDNVIAPVGTAIGKGAAWVGTQIGKGASWVAKKTGITKLWHKIFPSKKDKAKKAE